MIWAALRPVVGATLIYFAMVYFRAGHEPIGADVSSRWAMTYRWISFVMIGATIVLLR